jgi:hypothetical protein
MRSAESIFPGDGEKCCPAGLIDRYLPFAIDGPEEAVADGVEMLVDEATLGSGVAIVAEVLVCSGSHSVVVIAIAVGGELDCGAGLEMGR